MKSFGSPGIVYDLSAIQYFGSCNDLAGYAHYYHSNYGNKEITFVLAVTRDHGIPVHHRILPGRIVSVSIIENFVSVNAGQDWCKIAGIKLIHPI